MKTIKFDCIVDENHQVVLTFPADVKPGRHKLTIVIDPVVKPEKKIPVFGIAKGEVIIAPDFKE
jgi:hypothetical protein